MAPLGLGFFLVSSWIFHLNPETDFSTEIYSGSPLITFHVASTVLGNIFFALTCAVSLTLIFEEHLLKKRKLHTLVQKLPSLASLDALQLKVLAVGFFLMFLGVISGVLILNQIAAPVDYSDPRLVISASTLFLLAALLAARLFSGFRGRRAAWLTVTGFLLITVSSIGLKYSESFHVY